MSSPPRAAAEVVQSWYDEGGKYSFSRHSGAGTGHFTQVVWADSTHVGAARSADGEYLVVRETELRADTEC